MAIPTIKSTPLAHYNLTCSFCTRCVYLNHETLFISREKAHIGAFLFAGVVTVELIATRFSSRF